MALLTIIRDLHRRKGRERRGLALAEGVRLVEEMVTTGVRCKGAAVSPALGTTERGIALRHRLAKAAIPMLDCTDAELAGAAATEHPQGVIAVYAPRDWTLSEVLPRPRHPLVVLDALQDPGNVGTIARTALALGASGIVALPGTADLTNPKTVRGAMGALFGLPSCHATIAELVDAVRDANAEMVVTAMDGEAIGTARFDRPVALVLGNEGAGVGEEIASVASRSVAIPMADHAESLNVAVAAGIMLYALRSAGPS